MVKLTVNVGNRTMVKPAEETPREALWLSNVDLITTNVHVPSVYFYRDGGDVATAAVKDSLAKILVPYYPFAGRMGHDDAGRLEVRCNGEGVLFLEAETDAAIDDFGDFTPSLEMRKLVPVVDRSVVGSYPLLLVQVTRFKCGGVSVGIALEHRLADGFSALSFINLWSQVARGLNHKKLEILLDKAFLRARDPPRPEFDHYEYGDCPSLEGPVTYESKFGNGRTDQPNGTILSSSFKLSADQIAALKAKANEDKDNQVRYSTYEVVAGHVWRSACLARGLVDGQHSKLYMATNGRTRLQPPVPNNFFGNVVFAAATLGVAGDLTAKPVWYAASKIREGLAKMDDAYLRSAIDFLELRPDLRTRGRGTHMYGSPNLGITSWIRLSLYDADFGWGRPVSAGPAGISIEGKSYILPGSNDDNDRSMVVAIALHCDDMKLFEKYLYDI